MDSEVSGNPLEEFPPQVRQDVDGILHLGALTADVEFCGHSFGLRTLKAGEEIAASSAIQSFRDTLKEPDAWAAAQVGLALTHVDGEDDFCPQAGPDLTQFAKARFRYITSNWYPPTIDFLYHEYTLLLRRQIEAFRAMQNLSQRSRAISLPSDDSLSELGISLEGMPSGIPNSH